MTMQDLDRQALKALNTFTCPECGAALITIILDGAPVGFDCIACEEFFSYDNIACT